MRPESYPGSRPQRAIPHWNSLQRRWKGASILCHALLAALLLAAVPDDIDLLLEVKAAVMMRLSDECLYEVARIDRTLRRLGRSRYRKVTGLTEKVEAR